MSDNTQLTPEALAQAVAAIRERVSKARDEVSGLCLGTRKWRMSIPVQATDSDVVITSALNDVDTLVQALAVAEARAGRAEAFFLAIDGLSVLSSTVQFMNGASKIAEDFILSNPEEYRRIHAEAQARASVQSGTSAALADDEGNGGVT